MTVEHELLDGGVLVLTPRRSERLDLSNAAAFKAQATAAIGDATAVVIDLSEIAFVDSSGLGALLSCLRDVAGRGGRLRLCGVQRRVQVMFELVRMHRVVPIDPDRARAAVAIFEADSGD